MNVKTDSSHKLYIKKVTIELSKMFKIYFHNNNISQPGANTVVTDTNQGNTLLKSLSVIQFVFSYVLYFKV